MCTYVPPILPKDIYGVVKADFRNTCTFMYSLCSVGFINSNA